MQLLAILVGLPILACNTSPNSYIAQPSDTPLPPAAPLPPNTPMPATPQMADTPRPPDTPLPVPTASRGNSGSGFEAMYFTANSLNYLVANSSVIVVGIVPNRDPDTVRAPDKSTNNAASSITNVQAVGSGYNIHVEQYLKGNGGDTIPVVQFYGLDYTDDGQRKEARDKNDNLLLGKNNRYLLFLRENGTYPGYWIGTSYPYKFLLADGKAKAESPVGDLDGAFPDKPQDDFIAQVESLIANSPN